MRKAHGQEADLDIDVVNFRTKNNLVSSDVHGVRIHGVRAHGVRILVLRKGKKRVCNVSRGLYREAVWSCRGG